MTAAAVVEFVDGTSATIWADTEEGVASLRQFAEGADRPGESVFADAYVAGVHQPLTVDHDLLAAVRLVTS